MAKVTVETIQQLREKTGVGMLDCKKALEEAGGDIEKAVDLLRAKGAKVAAKRSGNVTEHGHIHAYIHPGANMGVLLQIACETDFSANTDAMKQFAHDICMHIAAMSPLAVSREELDQNIIDREKSVYLEQLKETGKPQQVIDKILEGKIQKFYEQSCLLDQPYIKNDKITVQDYLNELIAKISENIVIKRFARYHVGS